MPSNPLLPKVGFRSLALSKMHDRGQCRARVEAQSEAHLSVALQCKISRFSYTRSIKTVHMCVFFGSSRGREQGAHTGHVALNIQLVSCARSVKNVNRAPNGMLLTRTRRGASKKAARPAAVDRRHRVHADDPGGGPSLFPSLSTVHVALVNRWRLDRKAPVTTDGNPEPTLYFERGRGRVVQDLNHRHRGGQPSAADGAASVRHGPG